MKQQSTENGEYPIPTLEEIEIARSKIEKYIAETPMWKWDSPVTQEMFGKNSEVFLKLELLQQSGTFKPRGALTVMLSLSDKELAKGVTTVSAGNHAIALAFAAKHLNTTLKVAMPKSANQLRINKCRELGAEVVLCESIESAFERVEEIREYEGRILVHPFEGPYTTLGTATLGLEIANQVKNLDAIIVPVGGGGLCSGVAAAIKQKIPKCKVFGVEPSGANAMARSMVSGRTEQLTEVKTIADSLGAPYTLPYSFNICRMFVDGMVEISDDDMVKAMSLLFEEVKLAVEPAGAASTAAAIGPLNSEIRDKRIVLLVCGSNIDISTFCSLVKFK